MKRRASSRLCRGDNGEQGTNGTIKRKKLDSNALYPHKKKDLARFEQPAHEPHIHLAHSEFRVLFRVVQYMLAPLETHKRIKFLGEHLP